MRMSADNGAARTAKRGPHGLRAPFGSVATPADAEPDWPARVTDANRNALAHVRTRAERERAVSLARIRGVLSSVGGGPYAVDALSAAVRRVGMVTVNFHPDRLLADGRSVAEALCEEGGYRNQFETGISNGGLTAFPGGERDRWEEAAFGGAYQSPGVREW